jgi:hypothetical protein
VIAPAPALARRNKDSRSGLPEGSAVWGRGLSLQREAPLNSSSQRRRGMSHARVGISAVLDAAQEVIDTHRTSPGCFGRCMECGGAWPCEPRRRASISFYLAERLPRRMPADLAKPNGLKWSPVAWFGGSRLTTVAQGAPVPAVLKYRAMA